MLARCPRLIIGASSEEQQRAMTHHLTEFPRTLDLTSPFVEVGRSDVPAGVSDSPGGYQLTLELPGVSVEEIEIEVSVPLLYVRRLDEPDSVRTFLLLSHVDPASLRATLEHGTLTIEARRPWAPPRRLPVRSDFLWEGRVAHRPGDPLPPRSLT
jgi:HSP20 family molecular chaperone IbpA